jgi:hypothetical protein
MTYHEHHRVLFSGSSSRAQAGSYGDAIAAVDCVGQKVSLCQNATGSSARKNNIGVLPVPLNYLPIVWPHVREFLEAGDEAGGHIFDEAATLKDLHSGALLLWVGYEGSRVFGAVVTQIMRREAGLTCYWMTIGGDHMERWFHLQAEIEAYARACGCVRMRLEGRCGWKRLLPDYQQAGVILEKAL